MPPPPGGDLPSLVEWIVRIPCLAALALGAPACWDVAQGQTVVDAPDGGEAAFGPLGDYLDRRCGTLDCHGQVGRDLRIWGCNGMRLDAGAVPDCVTAPTTPDEHTATFRSLVGLEPEVMSVVVQGHGAHPELLTFVRKARGTETHKGGQLVTPGDVQDTCIVSWLAGNTNVGACLQALTYPIFPSPDAGSSGQTSDASSD